MPKIQDSVTVSAPIEKVWEVVTDFEARPKWAPRVQEVEILGGGPLKEGSDIRIQVGRRAFIPKVVELRPRERLVLRAGGAAVKADHIYEVASSGDGSTLTLTAQYGGPLGAIFGLLLRKQTRRDIADELSAMKRAIESGG